MAARSYGPLFEKWPNSSYAGAFKEISGAGASESGCLKVLGLGPDCRTGRIGERILDHHHFTDIFRGKKA